jgi:type I restriction enzyme S subunit
MKKGWKTKTLEEACEFSNGLWKGEKPPFVKVGVIRNTNFTKDGRLDDSDIAYLDVEVKKLEKRRLQFGDIILEKSGGGPKQPVGRVALFDKEVGDFSFSNFTAALRVLDPDNLDFRFVHKFLHWTYVSGVTEGMQSNSTGIRNLDGDAYKAIEIRFPSLVEQQRIVGLLDEAFEGLATAKANAETNLQNARALFESHLQSVFTQRGPGWHHDQLDALTEPDTPVTYGVVKPGDEGEIAFVRGGDLVRGKVRLTQLRTITRAVSDQYRRTLLRGGELLICLVGQPGQVAVAPIELAGANIARQVGLIRLKKMIDAEFVRYFLQSAPGAEALGARESGSVQQVINLGELRQVSVHYPEIAQQRKIVAALETMEAATERLTCVYARKLAALEALKKSLLHQAFTGQL